MLGPFTAAIRRYRSDRYHWLRLAVPFHPLEPDVLGILDVTDKVLAARQSSVDRIVSALPLGEEALTLIQGGLRQYHAWRD